MVISFVFEDSDEGSKAQMKRRAELAAKENAKMSRLQKQVRHARARVVHIQMSSARAVNLASV